MARTLYYIIVNDKIIVKPVKFEMEVITQHDINNLKKIIAANHNLPEENKKIEEENKLMQTDICKYEVLFSIHDPGELTP